MQPMAVLNAAKSKSKDPENPNNLYQAAPTTAPVVCPETGGRMKVGGPFWSAPIHDKEVVDAVVARLRRRMRRGKTSGATTTTASAVDAAASAGDAAPEEDVFASYESLPVPTIDRLHGLLTAVSEELPDVPFFYNMSQLCAEVKATSIPLEMFHSALVNGGYRVSACHKEPLAIKTDAPDSVVWDIIRCWCKVNPPEGSAHRKAEDGATARAILSKEPVFIANFTPASKGPKVVALRHPPNPESFWGPKRRAGRPAPTESAPKDSDSGADCAVSDDSRKERSRRRGDINKKQTDEDRARSRSHSRKSASEGRDSASGPESSAQVDSAKYFELNRDAPKQFAPGAEFSEGTKVLYGKVGYPGIIAGFDGTRYIVRHDERSSPYDGLCIIQSPDLIFDMEDGTSRRSKRVRPDV
jgi:hypothetical protein